MKTSHLQQKYLLIESFTIITVQSALKPNVQNNKGHSSHFNTFMYLLQHSYQTTAYWLLPSGAVAVAAIEIAAQTNTALERIGSIARFSPEKKKDNKCRPMQNEHSGRACSFCGVDGEHI